MIRLRKKDFVYGAVFFLFLLLSFILKLKSPDLVESLYNRQSFGLLHSLVKVEEIKPLAYYQGTLENMMFGPLQSLIYGFLFLGICRLYLPRAGALAFGLAVFFYLTISRPEILFYPPFGESITGHFTDALWLYQHNLDYIGLLHQDTFTKGGPQIYPTSLYPLFLAFLMTAIPSTKVFLCVLHLLYFAMASAIISFIRHVAFIALRDEKKSLLIALLVLFLPLFQSMSELLNLEIPCLFFSALSMFFVVKNHWGKASFFALASIFVKDPGVIACAAVLIAAVLKWLSDENKKRNLKILFWPILMIIIVVVKSIIRSQLIGEQKPYNMIRLGCGWNVVWASPWFWIYALCLFLLLIFSVIRLKKQDALLKSFFTLSSLVKFFNFLANKNIAVFLMFLMTMLWYLLYSNFLTALYRYQLLLMPFVIFSIAYSFYWLMKKTSLAHKLVIIALFIELISSHGLIYANLTADELFNYGMFRKHSDEKECTPTCLERSLEYRNYLKLEKILVKDIEENYAPYAIAAPFQTAQILSFPQLGYVTKKLDVTLYGMPVNLGIKPFLGVENLDLSKTVWIGFPYQRHPRIRIPYPIDPNDKILKKFYTGHIEVDIFMGGIAVERMRRIALWTTYKASKAKKQ